MPEPYRSDADLVPKDPNDGRIHHRCNFGHREVHWLACEDGPKAKCPACELRQQTMDDFDDRF